MLSSIRWGKASAHLLNADPAHGGSCFWGGASSQCRVACLVRQSAWTGPVLADLRHPGTQLSSRHHRQRAALLGPMVPFTCCPQQPSNTLSAACIVGLQVMKYKTLTPVTGIDVGMQREWLIGQQLNTLKGEDGKLHGARCVERWMYGSAPQLHLPVSCPLAACPGPCGHWRSLGAYAAASSLLRWPALSLSVPVTRAGFMATGAAIIQDDGMLVGLLIERVNGWPVEKRLTKDESFADINYLLECLRQVRS